MGWNRKADGETVKDRQRAGNGLSLSKECRKGMELGFSKRDLFTEENVVKRYSDPGSIFKRTFQRN